MLWTKKDLYKRSRISSDRPRTEPQKRPDFGQIRLKHHPTGPQTSRTTRIHAYPFAQTEYMTVPHRWGFFEPATQHDGFCPESSLSPARAHHDGSSLANRCCGRGEAFGFEQFWAGKGQAPVIMSASRRLSWRVYARLCEKEVMFCDWRDLRLAARINKSGIGSRSAWMTGSLPVGWGGRRQDKRGSNYSDCWSLAMEL